VLALCMARPAHAELAWPALCERLEAPAARQPDEVRRYRMLLNDRPAGREVFRFWHEAGSIRVLVSTSFDGTVLMFPADLRHCRDERWREEAGTLQLIRLESATRFAAPFRPDYEIHIERDPERGDIVYRGGSAVGSFEERHPANSGAITTWSIRTVTYDRLLDLFAHRTYPIESRLIGRAAIDGREIARYATAGAWPRHLWYEDGKMIRFCGEEPFGTYIESVLEAYADLKIAALGLSRPCAELFE
ncbi:MAG TPA: hypothetical protein VFV80_01065, partial [Geminicoccaceae bacterium]|nr:hypothetical protein [Geminicoccaceae bacterium]